MAKPWPHFQLVLADQLYDTAECATHRVNFAANFKVQVGIQ